ncbi:NAD-dependent epimerase/dehydratase family protein [Mesobacillus maritimus]|uniref:NAD-dependent epimerase/dehydratase family protein n=1 Tax=Mesobacillus maritimus TaxID=1643336 RepID=UPI00384E429D
MKAIVTGGEGFIGSHLVEELILSGVKESIIDILVSGSLDYVHPLSHLHTVDIDT